MTYEEEMESRANGGCSFEPEEEEEMGTPAKKTQMELATSGPQPIVPLEPELGMIQLAIEKGAGIETIERLVALQEKMLARKAEIEFNEALNRVQSKIRRVAPDLENTQTRSRYASYAAIDRVIRPIYAEEGFSLSFSEEDCPNKPEHVRIVCFVSKGAYTRLYRKDMPADGKGAKGGDVMTKTHAAGAADSYAKRYLVKDIFNVAIGEDDNDGNGAGSHLESDQVEEFCRQMGEVNTLEELKAVFAKAYAGAQTASDRGAMARYIQAKDAAKRRLA